MKDIPGYEGIYAAHRDGKIWSYRRNKFLKPRLKGGGNYLELNLCNLGNTKRMKVHRIIALTFLKNPKNLPQVNHKNCITTDNQVENLEWCTNKPFKKGMYTD